VAAIAQFIGIRFQVSGFGCQEGEEFKLRIKLRMAGTANSSLRRAQAEGNIESAGGFDIRY
jgi:hypothetical protein